MQKPPPKQGKKSVSSPPKAVCVLKLLAGGMLLFTLNVLPAFGLTEFAKAAALIRAQSVDQLAALPLVTWNKGARQQYVLRRTEASDGSFVVEGTGEQVSVVRKFRKDGTMISVLQKDAQGELFEQVVDAQRTQVRTKISKNGQLKSDFTTRMEASFVLQAELNNVVSQAWKAGIHDGLLMKSLSPDGSLAADFQILFRETRNPLALSDSYDYPEEMTRAVKPGDYLVADMSLLGVGALFFPDHFYIAYSKTPKGLEFVAYYGDNPKNAMFQFSPR